MLGGATPPLHVPGGHPGPRCVPAEPPCFVTHTGHNALLVIAGRRQLVSIPDSDKLACAVDTLRYREVD